MALDYLPPMGGDGPYELQAADFSRLYRFNRTARAVNANDFLKVSTSLESASGSAVVWDTGDGQFAGGPLIFQERKYWRGASDEAADLNALRLALKTTPTYLANVENGRRCLLLPGSWRDVVPIRADRKYGLSELNTTLKPANKDDAALVIMEGDA